MSCISNFLTFKVPACDTVATTLTADVTGEHHFVFNWLGVQYKARINATESAALLIDGEWFNEGAAVVGYFEKPDGTKVTDGNGVSEIHVSVIKTIAI